MARKENTKLRNDLLRDCILNKKGFIYFKKREEETKPDDDKRILDK